MNNQITIPYSKNKSYKIKIESLERFIKNHKIKTFKYCGLNKKRQDNIYKTAERLRQGKTIEEICNELKKEKQTIINYLHQIIYDIRYRCR